MDTIFRGRVSERGPHLGRTDHTHDGWTGPLGPVRIRGLAAVAWCVGLLITCLAGVPRALASDPALRGATAVMVTVDAEGGGDAVSGSILQAEIERVLGQGEVRVMRPEEMLGSTRPTGILWLRFEARKYVTENLLYSMMLAYREPVLLARDTSIELNAITWERRSFGVTRATDAKEIIAAVRELTVEFVSEHSVANPGGKGR